MAKMVTCHLCGQIYGFQHTITGNDGTHHIIYKCKCHRQVADRLFPPLPQARNIPRQAIQIEMFLLR